MKKLSGVEYVVAGMIAVVSLGVYGTTICPSVSFTDSGELASIIVTLGIAHPTGYPLFTLVGRLAVLLPFASTRILQLNLFGAFLTSAAAGLFFLCALTIRKSSSVFGTADLRESDRPRFMLSAAAGSLLLAFSSTFWSQSTAIEVYALQLVLVLLTTMTFVKGIAEEGLGHGSLSRYLILFAFVLGLNFSNHMTTVLLAPGFLWLYFRTFGFKRSSLGRIVRLVPWFVLGLSVYAYVPIRAAARPPLDWGHPASAERFLWHVTGKQYRVWMFSGMEIAAKQLKYFFGNISNEFHWLVILFFLVGVALLFKRSRRLAIFLVLLFVSSVAYAINYDIHDIDSYFLIAYLSAAWFCVFGIEGVIQFAGRTKSKVLTASALIGIVGMVAWECLKNRPHVDESQNLMVRGFVDSTLSHIEPNAVVFSGIWDYFVSPMYYEQLVEHRHRDIVVIDKSLLQNRSWYFLQLERNQPWLITRCRPSIQAFLNELDKFERGAPFSFGLIQARWNQLLEDLVKQSLVDHAVYVDGRIEPEFPQTFTRTPTGLLIRLSSPGDSVAARIVDFRRENWDFQSPAAEDQRRYCSLMFTEEAAWVRNKGFLEDSKKLLEDALMMDPTNSVARDLLIQAGMGR